jgi:hypothetical protein
MTDEEMAEAVIGGLSNMMQCDCGVFHTLGILKGKNRHGFDDIAWSQCNCRPKGGSHRHDRVYCPCGTEWGRGKRIGWRVTRRTHKRWKIREKDANERIAQLEARIAAWQ